MILLCRARPRSNETGMHEEVAPKQLYDGLKPYRAAKEIQRTLAAASAIEGDQIGARSQCCIWMLVAVSGGIMFASRLAMIHNVPAMISNTIRTPNAKARTLFVLSGPLVM
jgi:hypothetical protein